MVDATVQGQTSTTESVQTSTTEPVAIQASAPSAEEVLNQKIAEAVTKALTTETEKSRREIQSAKDKAMAEVQSAQRRARLAESTVTATQRHLESLDPDTAKELELAQLRAEREGRMTMEQEEQMRRQQDDFHNRFQSGLSVYAQRVGVDPKDARLDWNIDPADYLGSQERFLISLAKIQNEKSSGLAASVATQIKEAEKRIKKDLGVEDFNSVSTQVSGGVSASGIPTDMKKFREWISDVPSDEYKKLKPEIDKMMADGKIK